MNGRVAAVDIGTNTTRLLIAEKSDGRLSTLVRRTEITGLGKGLDKSGVLSGPAMERTLAALAEYRKTTAEYGVGRLRAVATSAVREAGNSAPFLQQAEMVWGTRPDIISGQEEGRLAFAGATYLFNVSLWDKTKKIVVVDIGGGSTEFVTHDDCLSVEIGAVRLTDRCLPVLPTRPGQLEEAISEVLGILKSSLLPTRTQVVGVAGTWTSLAAIARYPSPSEGAILSSQDLKEMLGWMSELTLAEMETVAGLHPKRAPVILAGAVIAQACLHALGRNTISVTNHDLLDGVALGLE